MNARHTLAAPASLQQDVRKSRFLARAAPVERVEQALEFLERVRESDATHNCWAYRVDAQYRFNDDGEPSGTAGKPILQAIDGQGLDRVVVVVARWFGGIKLGAGGLVRAYGGCAAECLRLAPKLPLIALAAVRVRCDFASAATLRARLVDYDAVKRNETFFADGAELEIELPAARLDAFIALVRDLTRGRGRIEVL
ncbi:MAG: IMPACT family protein [Rhodanobacteraceae bacterium]